MSILKIKSPFVFKQLFSFVSKKRKFKIIKNNSFLNKKLDLSLKDYKEFFIKKKIEKYNFIYVNYYWINFKNELNEIIENDSFDLISNVLSKKEDFILKLDDDYFNSIIDNPYFKENARFEINLNINDLPKILLLKDNIKLKEKIELIKNNKINEIEERIKNLEKFYNKNVNFKNKIIFKQLFSFILEKRKFKNYKI